MYLVAARKYCSSHRYVRLPFTFTPSGFIGRNCADKQMHVAKAAPVRAAIIFAFGLLSFKNLLSPENCSGLRRRRRRER